MATRNVLPNLNPALQAGLDELPIAVYARYSRNPNGTVDSTANQVEGATVYCETPWPGRTIVVYADDNISASDETVERPEFNRMRADIRAGRIGAVVSKTQSRLTRNQVEWHKLRKDCLAVGIDVWHTWVKNTIVEIGKGKALKSKFDLIVDSDYGETVSLNISAGLATRAREGKASGGVCFGYVRGLRPTSGGGTLIPDPEVKGIPQEIFDRVLAGETVQAIAEDLTMREVPTVRGRALWRPSTVRALLRAPTLTGLRVYQATIVGEGEWEPVVTRESWDAMQAFLGTPGSVTTRDGRRVKRGHKNGHTRYLASDIAVCPHCATTLTGSKRANRAPMYLCSSSRGGCERLSVSVKGVDAVIRTKVLNALTTKKVRAFLASKDINAPKRDALMAELVEIAEERRLDVADKEAKRMSRATWLDAARAHDLREDDIRVQLASLPAPKDNIDPDVVLDSWDDLTLVEQRRVLRALVSYVEIRPATRGGNRFDASRVRVHFR